MKATVSRLLALGLAVTTSACSQHANAVPNDVPHLVTAKVRLTIHVPAKPPSSARGRHFVSPSTQSLGFEVAPHGGSLGPATYLDCSSGQTCTTDVDAPIGSDDFQVALYSQPDGAGPFLGFGNLTQTIVENQVNVIPITIDGVVHSAVVSIDKTSLPAGTAGTANVTVQAYDVGGNLIVAPGGWDSFEDQPYAVTVTSTDHGGCGGPGKGRATFGTVTFDGTGPSTVAVAYDGGQLSSTTFSASDDGPTNQVPAGSGLTGTSLTLTYVPAFDKYAVLSSPADYVTTGPDGALWATETSAAKIARIDPATLAVTEFSTVATVEASEPAGIVSGPDGNLWFADEQGYVGSLTTSGTVTKYNLGINTLHPTLAKSAAGIASAGGKLWFTENNFDKIGSITPGSGAQLSIAETTIPSGTDVQPLGITLGPDGNLWFTERAGKNVGKIAPATSAITEYPFAPAANGSNYPVAIASGYDGQMWFSQTDNNMNEITTSGSSTQTFNYVPAPSVFPPAYGIVPGPDCTEYFSTYESQSFIERMTSGGTYESYEVPDYPGHTGLQYTSGITMGSDGHVWFTEHGQPIVARLAI